MVISMYIISSSCLRENQFIFISGYLQKDLVHQLELREHRHCLFVLHTLQSLSSDWSRNLSAVTATNQCAVFKKRCQPSLHTLHSVRISCRSDRKENNVKVLVAIIGLLQWWRHDKCTHNVIYRVGKRTDMQMVCICEGLNAKFHRESFLLISSLSNVDPR